jgi:hypothetical protein
VYNRFQELRKPANTKELLMNMFDIYKSNHDEDSAATLDEVLAETKKKEREERSKHLAKMIAEGYRPHVRNSDKWNG